jgi:O-acetyl-ADP-ribose deacetylase (regulator of RNase III)
MGPVGTGHDFGVRIELLRGDITAQKVDAIVNAANSSLLGGGGVDGAIHRRGGPAILEECRAHRASRYPDGLPAGEAVATTAGNLPARWVIHTVGPVWDARQAEARTATLRSCYARSLAVADELGAGTVAFPLISSGAFGWPLDDAVRQALTALAGAETAVEEARLVLFGEGTLAVAQRVAASS